MQIYKNGHLKSQVITALLNQELNDDITLEVCEHIADCQLCSLKMAELADSCCIRTAPRGITDQINRRILSFENSKTKSFVQYCISVVAGIAAVITVVFSGAIIDAEIPIFHPTQNVSRLQKPEHPKLSQPQKQNTAITTPKKLAPPNTNTDNKSLLDQINQYFTNIFSPEE